MNAATAKPNLKSYSKSTIPEWDPCRITISNLFQKWHIVNRQDQFYSQIFQQILCSNLQCLYKQVIRPALLNFYWESAL